MLSREADDAVELGIVECVGYGGMVFIYLGFLSMSMWWH